MASPNVNAAGFYADFARMEQLRNTAQRDPQAAVKAAARQFEGLFTQMMLKSMRQASLGEGLGDSEETKFYQDMFDQQLSVQLSNGKGIGLADRLIAQLQRTGQAGGPPPAHAPAAAGDVHSLPAAKHLAPPIVTTALPQATPTDPTNTDVAAPPAVAPMSAPTAQPASGDAAATAEAMSARPPTQREAFIASLQPAAERVARQLGVSTETILAHAALETGWGRHLPAAAGNNLFGIKAGAGWQGASATATTTEYTRGAVGSTPAAFRTYATREAALDDYAALVGGSARYAGAVGSGDDVAAYARGLQRGGYATDPAYVQKLVDTAASVRQVIAASPLKVDAPRPTTPAGETG